MKAITVRDSNGILISFGPEGKGYNPGVPVGAVKAVEDSYDAIYAEYAYAQSFKPKPESLEDQVARLQTQVSTLSLMAGVGNVAGPQN